MNSSMYVADLDLSRLDARRQAELAAVLEDKDNLIMEKSKLHKDILNDFSQLKESYIIKETENERLKKALIEQKQEIQKFRDSMKAQYEDVVQKLKFSEETIKDLAGFLTSVTKLAVFNYSSATRSFNEAGKPYAGTYQEQLEPLLKDLDKSFRGLSEKHKKNPKRLLTYLEESKHSYNYIKERVDGKLWQQAYENLAKTKEDEKRDRLSIRKESIKRPGQIESGLALGQEVLSEAVLSKLDPESRIVVEKAAQMMIKFRDGSKLPDTSKEIFLATAEFTNATSGYVQDRLDVYFATQKPYDIQENEGKMQRKESSDSSVARAPGSPTYQLKPPLPPSANQGKDFNKQTLLPGELLPRVATLRQKLESYRDQLTSAINSEAAALQFDLTQFLEETTGIDEEMFEALKMHQQLKEQVCMAKLSLESAQTRLAEINKETEAMKTRLAESQISSQDADKMFEEERALLDVMVSKVYTLESQAREKEAESTRLAKKREEIFEESKRLTEVVKEANSKFEAEKESYWNIVQETLKLQHEDQFIGLQTKSIQQKKIDLDLEGKNKPQLPFGLTSPDTKRRVFISDHSPIIADKQQSPFTDMKQIEGGRKDSDSPINPTVTPIKIDQQPIKKIYGDQSPTKAPAATPLHHDHKEELDNLDFVRDDKNTQEKPQDTNAQAEQKSSRVGDVTDSNQSGEDKQTFTKPTAEEGLKQQQNLDISGMLAPLAMQLATLPGITEDLDQQLHSLGMRFKQLCSELAKYEAEQTKTRLFQEELKSLNEQIVQVTFTCQDTIKKRDELQFELNKKKQQLNALIAEEKAAKESYIKCELRMEINQQKMIQVQADIAKLQSQTDETKREIENKRRDLLVKNDQLNKTSNKLAIEMQELKRLDEEAHGRRTGGGVESNIGDRHGNFEPLLHEYNTVQGGHVDIAKKVSIDVSYFKVSLACALPMAIAYLLYLFRILR